MSKAPQDWPQDWVNQAFKRVTDPELARTETVHYEGRLVMTVKVEAYDIVSDDGLLYVPGEVMAELYKTAILKAAHPSVVKALQWEFVGVGRYPIITDSGTAVTMRAKVTVLGHFTGTNIGFASMTPQQAQFATTLKDEIIEIIDEFEPPKSAWVADETLGAQGEKVHGRGAKRRRDRAERKRRKRKPKARN